MIRAPKWVLLLVGLLLAAACAPTPPTPRTALASYAAQASAEPTAPLAAASVDTPLAAASASAASTPTEPAPPATRSKTAPRRAKARPVTSDVTAALIGESGEGFHGETLRVSRCPAGSARPNAEAKLPLPKTALGLGLARGADKIFAAAYFALGLEGEPTSSQLYVFDERLTLLRQTPLRAPRNGDTTSSLALAADERYLATYENDGSDRDTATVELLDASDLHVIAKATVGASRTIGGGVRKRLLMTEDDLYVLASILPARRERSTGNKVVHTAEEYVVTRLALPTLAVIAQRPIDIYELGDATMTLQRGKLSITDGLRLATLSLDLAKRTTIDIPPPNGPPPPHKPACGERPRTP